MRTYVTLPAVVRGSLFPYEGEHRGMGPTLEWYLDPVANGHEWLADDLKGAGWGR